MMLYLHIPFCVQKCLYCDFCSLPGQGAETLAAYAAALCRELELRSCREEITSVFLGGGTPSLLPEEALASIFEAIGRNYSLSADCEISLEANPGTLRREFLRTARAAGVNRLSIGVQALQDRLLRSIGRIHSAAQAKQALDLAREAGFENLSVDLMYALPGQSEADLLESVDFVLAEGLPHVSLYALTVEPRTPFGRLQRQGKLDLPGEEAELAMQGAAMARLAEGGLKRYEVSNFARPGLECRHNLGYWQRAPYLGLGLAAHGFDGRARYANTEDLGLYLSALSRNELPPGERQALAPGEAEEEELLLGLRMVRGVELAPDRLAALAPRLDPLLRAGFLTLQGRRLALTEKGFPVMNALLVRLL